MTIINPTKDAHHMLAQPKFANNFMAKKIIPQRTEEEKNYDKNYTNPYFKFVFCKIIYNQLK
jgi:hypothetical protein